MAETRAEPRSGGRCPICGKPREAAWRPFCSRRCADVDLARWLKGAYAIPSPEVPGEAGADGEDEGGAGA